MTLAFRSVAESTRGLVRRVNQDAAHAGVRLVAVADGLGGHVAGEVASGTVVEYLALMERAPPVVDLHTTLSAAVDACSTAIADRVSEDPRLRGMGTTLTALLLSGEQVGLVHVGDSRAYRMREGSMSLLTRDDTFVQSMVDRGLLSAEEGAAHPQRSMLLKAIQADPPTPTIQVITARVHDRYLLCSDGLSDLVAGPVIESVLSMSEPRACARWLVELALQAGAPDNVTCVVADVHRGPHPMTRGPAG